jgi:DNA-binding NarL/FixJ family response regulator
VGPVVQGLTNREAAERLFVSPRTVSTRLRHVFDKLKLNSRMELAVVAARHGVPTVCHRMNM